MQGVLAFTGTDDVEEAFLRLIGRGEPDLQPHDAASTEAPVHVAKHARAADADSGSEATR